MSKAQHTPAPWMTNDYHVSTGKKMIARCYLNVEGGEVFEVVKANATLIAAAPDMADIIEAFTKTFRGDPSPEGDAITGVYSAALSMLTKIGRR